MDTELILQRAAEHCVAQGEKLTLKRRQVLTCLIQLDKAMSAYELADNCKEAFGITLFPMSVYRILEFLQTVGLVHRLRTTNKFIACAHVDSDHSHDAAQFLVCKACDRVEEIGIANPLSEAFANKLETLGFQLMNKQVELECLCKDCTLTA